VKLTEEYRQEAREEAARKTPSYRVTEKALAALEPGGEYVYCNETTGRRSPGAFAAVRDCPWVVPFRRRDENGDLLCVARRI